jgi:adenylyltransferase/sulfurtransferase
MSRLDHLMKFTALGVFAVFIYLLDLSELMNAIANFIFFCCVAFIMILSVQTGYVRYRSDEKIRRQYIPKPDNTPKTELVFSDGKKKAVVEGRSRYHANELFREIGLAGQAELSQKCVAVVGLGNSGAYAAELLARAGIGHIRLIDSEAVGTYDMIGSRFFRETDLEKPRAEALEDFLKKANSRILVRGHMARLNEGNRALLDSDLVMDFTMDGKSGLGAYCRMEKIPLLSMSLSSSGGHVMAAGERGACLECQLETFEEGAGRPSMTISCMGAALITSLALKVLLKKKVDFDILEFDSARLEFDKSVVRQRPGCEVCGND